MSGQENLNVIEEMSIADGPVIQSHEEQTSSEEINPIVQLEDVVVVPSTAPAQVAFEMNEEERLRNELFEKLDVPERITSSEFMKETAETIKGVNYKTLKDIFDGMRRRSGVEGESGFCEIDRVHIDEHMSGGEHGSQNGISIGPSFLTKKEGQDFSRADFRNEILSTLVHEEAHASSHNIVPEKPDSGAKELWKKAKSLFKKQEPEKISGYQRNEFRKGEKAASFVDLNEGVTDKIAEEVYGEYLTRTGDRAVVSDIETPATYHVEAYLGSRAMVTAFIETIAASAGVPSDVAWDALKQGYMSGVDLRTTELNQAYEEVFSKGIMERLSEWGAGEEGKMHAELLEKAKGLQLTEDATERIRVAFERYGNAVEKKKEEMKKWRSG